jgi:hypothetical protein
MTPKEKAKELVDKFTGYAYDGISSCEENGIQIALIAIDEMIKFEERIIKEIQFLSDRAGHAFRSEGLYWNEVKKEIEKL